jgi:hypothetical protein
MLATLHQPPQTTPATTNQAGQHHITPKHKQNHFFFHRKSVSVTMKLEKRKKKPCSKELFDGTARMGIMPTWAVLPPEQPSTKQHK